MPRCAPFRNTCAGTISKSACTSKNSLARDFYPELCRRLAVDDKEQRSVREHCSEQDHGLRKISLPFSSCLYVSVP